MSTRFKGASSGEILSQSTVLNQDMIQTRHAVGNTMEDSDKGLPLSVIQSCPVALCSTSASTIKKTATVQNFTDFTLLSGREVIVYMSNGNSASEPSMNINGSGDIPLETSYWNAGTFMKLRYVEVDINGTTLKRWLVDQGASNTASQLNGALTKLLKVKDFYWYGSVSGSGAYYKNILSDIYTYCGATNIISVIEYYWSSIPVNHSLCLNDKALTLIYEKGYENQNVQIKCKIYYN